MKKIESSHQLKAGTPVFIVTREGEIIEGYSVESSLFDLVSLDRPPLEGTDKQGFTLDGELLRPNWCAGKKVFVAACFNRVKAEELAKIEKEKITRRIERGGKPRILGDLDCDNH